MSLILLQFIVIILRFSLFGTEKIFVVEFELSLLDPFQIFGVDEFLASLVLLFDLFLGLLVCNGLNRHVLFMDSMISSMYDSGRNMLVMHSSKLLYVNEFTFILSHLQHIHCT